MDYRLFYSFFNFRTGLGVSYKVSEISEIRTLEEENEGMMLYAASRALKNLGDLHKLKSLVKDDELSELLSHIYYKVHYDKSYKINYNKYNNKLLRLLKHM